MSMFKNISIAVGALFFHVASMAQFVPGESYFGQKNYIEYIAGNLPIIISAPHGGKLKPNDIPDRVCNNPTTVTDLNTNELALEIDTAFVNLMGCHPHLILTHLARTKLDANRDLADGACGNPEAENAWTEFHNFLDTAKKYVNKQYQKGFYIDLHGHGHAIQRLELGYLLTGNDYNKLDVELNAPAFINKSSLKNLIPNNLLNLTHADLLRGDQALGTLLMDKGYPSVPSKAIPTPGNDVYFDGGYNTENYTSAVGGTIDGVQIECNLTGVRDTKANRKKFAENLALVMQQYLIDNYGLQPQLQNCMTILPVKLSYFKTTWNNNSKQVDIKWQTTSETNNNYFEILRSDDGVIFSAIKTIQAKGNSEIPTDYAAYDNNFKPGKLYYKLRQHDKDGNYKDFEITVVNVPNTQNGIKISQANNEIKIYLPANENLPLQVAIFSATGTSVAKHILNLPGTNTISIHSLSPGMYIVKIYSQGLATSYKILKQ